MSVPTGTDASAPVRAHHEIDIDAPLRTVWQLHTDVNSWPAWQTEITAARQYDLSVPARNDPGARRHRAGLAAAPHRGRLSAPKRPLALAVRARYSSSRQSLQRMMVPGGYSKSVSPDRLKPAFRQIALDAG